MHSEISRKHFNEVRPSTERSVAHRRKTLRLKKPKAWSHQDELKPGTHIALTFLSGAVTNTREGVIIAADRFSIKLSTRLGEEVFFKSGLIRFQIIEDGADA